MLAEKTEKQMTAVDLLKLPPEQRRGELIQGEWHPMSPAGYIHGELAGNLFGLLWHFVRLHKLGKVYAAETGFLLSTDPDTVRPPDAAFVTTERAAQQTKAHGFFDGPPDLAVEVISPSETVESIDNKLFDYMESGTRQVWLVSPRTETVTIYRSLTDAQLLTRTGTLEGGDLLPGFSVPVAEIFA